MKYYWISLIHIEPLRYGTEYYMEAVTNKHPFIYMNDHHVGSNDGPQNRTRMLNFKEISEDEYNLFLKLRGEDII